MQPLVSLNCSGPVDQKEAEFTTETGSETMTA